MVIQIILLIIGFILLIKGADIFVDGASSTASNFKIPASIIGLTIVAFGTTAPEFAVSIKSILSDNSSIVIGNVIGSNITNILLILGISSIIHNMSVKSRTIKREIPILMIITISFSLLMMDNLFDKNIVNMFSRTDGILITLFFGLFVWYLIKTFKNKEDIEEIPKYTMKTSIFYIILGLIAIIVGSNLVVDNSTLIAIKLGLSDRIVGLTIIAFGTSLPELVTSIVAAMKKEYDIAIGNVVGSNIFNIGLVVGLPVTIFGGIPASSFSIIDIIALIGSVIILFLVSLKDRRISRIEGILMLLLFITYYICILI